MLEGLLRSASPTSALLLLSTPTKKRVIGILIDKGVRGQKRGKEI